MKARLCVLMICVVYTAHLFSAPLDKVKHNEQEPEFDIDALPEDLWDRSSDWLITKRNEWSTLVGDTGKRLDGFFAKDDAKIRTNNSFIKLSLENKWRPAGQIDTTPAIRFRLHLPSLQERLRIEIENDPDEYKSLKETNRPSNANNTTLATDTLVGAFRVLSNQRKYWHASTSLGIKIDNGIDPFWRARAHRQWQLGESPWSFRIHESIYYFHQDGWGNKNQAFFERLLPDSYFFRAKSEAKWLHHERRMEYAQIFSLQKELSPIRAVNYQLGMFAENQPKVQATDYFINVIYRRKLYKDWFFYEMTPELLFPKEQQFALTPSLTLRFEIVFSADNEDK